MKWVVVALVVLIVVAIIRRISRENTINVSAGGFDAPPLPSAGMMKMWEQRGPLAFEDFYAQYYSNSGIPAEDVQKVMKMIATATGVPEDRIRPDDRLEDLKPGALRVQLALLKRVLAKVQEEDATKPPPQWRQDTVDDVIRTLGPYGHYAHSASGG